MSMFPKDDKDNASWINRIDKRVWQALAVAGIVFILYRAWTTGCFFSVACLMEPR